MVDFVCREKYGLYDLVEIVKILRSENGCPWDKEQTHESVRRNFLEEAYEAVEAIDTKNPELLREELGDVLAQVVFHSQIEREAGVFDIDDVADGVCKKFIERHPHIFENLSVKDSDEVLKNWDEIKRRQKKQTTHHSAMDSVCRSLPGLWRAEKIQARAAKLGFDWEHVDGALEKLIEEIDELKKAIECGEGIADELGDVLFSAVNVARFLKVDPEYAIGGSSDKFIERFKYIETRASELNLPLADMGLSRMEALYNEAKTLVSAGK